MVPVDVLLLPPIAFLVGIIAAMVGIGGGVFIVPVLALIFDFTTHQAVGTSLVAIIFTSLSSALGYWRQRRIDYKVGTLLTVTTIPGAFVGAYITTFIITRAPKTDFWVLFDSCCLAHDLQIQPSPISTPENREELVSQDR